MNKKIFIALILSILGFVMQVVNISGLPDDPPDEDDFVDQVISTNFELTRTSL